MSPLAAGERTGLLRAVFDEAPVAILRARRVDGRAATILDANPGAALLLGRPIETLLGIDLRSVLVEGQALEVGPPGRAVRVAPATDPDLVAALTEQARKFHLGSVPGENVYEKHGKQLIIENTTATEEGKRETTFPKVKLCIDKIQLAAGGQRVFAGRAPGHSRS